MALAAASLLAHSHGLPTWRVLDTGMSPERLLSLWQAWRSMKAAPRVLHLVVICPSPASVDELLQAGQALGLQSLSTELAAQWNGLLPGFQRVSLADGRFQLTLCLGQLLPMLRELSFETDSLWLDATQAWDRWCLKALARCCRRGAMAVCAPPTTELQQSLGQIGFFLDGHIARYDPPWQIRNRHDKPSPSQPTDCAIIGAGLAGAAVAASLARRGWQVKVYDAAPAPAAGASGLPVGLLVPHVSSDDSPRSRLSRAGLRLTRHEAQRLLRSHQDWAPTGVLERRLGRPLGLPRWWPTQDTELSQSAAPVDALWHADTEHSPELWHPQAAWIKPAALVKAWLRTAGVQFIGDKHVTGLQQLAHGWRLVHQNGQTLSQASHVVLANAVQSTRLLSTLQEEPSLPALQAVRGRLSFGPQLSVVADMLPAYPVNGLGSLIPGVPSPQGLAWYAGASYEDMQAPELPTEKIHQENFSKLRQLLPRSATALEPTFLSSQVGSWSGLRCVSPDRSPWVGALQMTSHPTLWISTAMGSRGLNLSFLCAELLAGWMQGEPLPLERSLAGKLALQRLHIQK